MPATDLLAARSRELHLLEVLRRLYSEQAELEPGNGYLREHASPPFVANQVLTFEWYAQHLPASGRVLDWGCNHTPDSCMLRAAFGDRFELHSCDFEEPARFRAFHDFARTQHEQLRDEISVPYPANHFDVVIASGVLEHTAMDDESLKELYRVLKPDGMLVISYLPNWLSLQEWRRRVIDKRDFHRRLYGMSEATRLLKHRGFYPTTRGYHTFFWQRRFRALGLQRWERALAELFSRVLPVHVFSSTLCFVARKVRQM